MELKSFLSFIGIMAVSGLAIGLVLFLLVGTLGSRLQIAHEPIKSPLAPTSSKSKKHSPAGGSKTKKKKTKKM